MPWRTERAKKGGLVREKETKRIAVRPTRIPRKTKAIPGFWIIRGTTTIFESADCLYRESGTYRSHGWIIFHFDRRRLLPPSYIRALHWARIFKNLRSVNTCEFFLIRNNYRRKREREHPIVNRETLLLQSTIKT